MNKIHRYLIIILINLIISSTFAQTGKDSPQGFFLDDWQPKTAVSPKYINTTQPAEPATVTISVNLKDTVTKVSKYIFGNNAIPWAGKMNTKTTLIKDITNLQPNVLRWPGGNLSNQHFWDAVQDKGPSDIPPTLKINPLNAGMNTTNWAMTTDNYYDLLAKTNSTGCICVNYSYARYGTGPNPVATAAHYAANWVRYDKGRTKFWEIGNENMGPWQAGYEIDVSLNQDGQPKTISGDLYGRHCRVFIDSMKSAAAQIGAEIKIGVGILEETVTYNPVMNKWNSGVIPQVADKADFLIIHSYYTPYEQNSGVSVILNSAAKTKDYKNYVLNDLKKYGQKDNLPIALTEWNIFAVGSKQQVSHINGIHAALILGELIRNQFGMAMRWDLANGWNNGDDHGLFARSDEPGVTEGTPHAPFYHMYYFQKYFGDVMVNSSVAGSSSIVSYASSFSSGESGIVVVNKGVTKQIVEIDLKNYPDAKSFYRFVLTGGTDNGDFSRKVFVNGAGPAGEGGGPKNYDTLEAYGKSINGKVKFEAPPLSVSYILVSADSIPVATSNKTLEKSSFKIYPNPSDGKFNIYNPDFECNKIEVVTLTGIKVAEVVLDNMANQTATFNLGLKSGIYIINIYGKNQRISEKLVVK